MKNILEIKNLSKSFNDGKKSVLDNVNINVEPGEIFGLVGLNGVGKTTIIKSIIGLLQRQDDCVIKVNNIDSLDFAVKKEFCYLPEKFQPSQSLTGIEFLDVFCRFFNKTLNLQEVKKLCNQLDLEEDALYTETSKFSKGMGQKIGLISAFLSNAKLLILDEPMSGLDPKARIAVKKVMQDYVKNGNSIFFSSHILADIDEICSRISILNNTKIIFTGTCENFKLEQKEQGLEKAFLKSIS